MKEIFVEKKEGYIVSKKESIKSNIYYGEDSFIYKLYKIDEILNSNVDFVNKVFKIRDNTKTLKQYDEEYISFIRLYNKVINDFSTKLKDIINIHMSKPSFILNLSIYYDDISSRILHEIISEKKNLQLLGMKLNIMFKDNKRYADELYALYCNYINSLNSIKDQLAFEKYTKKLK